MELRVEKGGLEARLLFAPVKNDAGGFQVPSLPQIEAFLKEKGVHAPLDASALPAALERLAHGFAAALMVGLLAAGWHLPISG